MKLKGLSDESITTARRKLAKNAIKKMQNQRLKEIHPYTFRHWKGTMGYHKTKDTMHVKYVLGHRNVETTQICINLENAIFSNRTGEFYAKTAKTPE